MIKNLTILIVLTFTPIATLSANNIKTLCEEKIISHSGGTDKCGCHYNRTTGYYHCHNRKQRGGSCPS
jgi:hypothetical protein